MALHPIKVLDHVLDEYRSYLQTEFRAKDANLKAALEAELDKPGFLAQEPFYQAHRPFRNGKRWRDLPLDPKLAGVMEKRSRSETAYLHQSLAIEELLSPDPKPVVVTTGTGSGKTEAFLLPVIQNAIEDAARYPHKDGLTAILVYPMNALANDQKQRIAAYIHDAGWDGTIRVEQYDRGTSQAKRKEMRDNPPHILLTNYMMLEYLLVRPADRDAIFANHRCRYLVLDEVHTYRGILGTNIALLVRRLRVHLSRAVQDWKADVPDAERTKRYPTLVPVGTSATIKSTFEKDMAQEELIRLRDREVQRFFGDLTGADKPSIRVFGEELQELPIPTEATYPDHPGRIAVHDLAVSDPDVVREGLCRLAGLPGTTPLDQAAKRYRLLWDLNHWLIKKPMSVSELVEEVRKSVPSRADIPVEEVRAEVEAALTLGAALPDGTPGTLRLRAHRFIRGGWKYHRCIDPSCGKLYPKGEDKCECGHPTAPLYLCRNCGADYLRFVGDPEERIHPSALESDGPEWMLYEPARFEDPPIEDDEDDLDVEDTGDQLKHSGKQLPKQIKQRPVLHGSFDPGTMQFSTAENDYPVKVILSPARNRCLCCGGTAGSRNVITPVALGTSAAVKVLGEGLVESLSEANQGQEGYDGKDRLLIFSDSRQDAAHQARFITFAGRYDRMRRNLVALLERKKVVTLQEAVEGLTEIAMKDKDNPHITSVRLTNEDRQKVQTWEEAPLLDELAVNPGYRATVVNLGLVGVEYEELDDYIRSEGKALASQFGITVDQLIYICRCLLDQMRVRGALSRELLLYHPRFGAYPKYLNAAEWERRIKTPQGYPVDSEDRVATRFISGTVQEGIKVHNAWRGPKGGGNGPATERLVRHLFKRLGGTEPTDETMESLIKLLYDGQYLKSMDVAGLYHRQSVLQVNAGIVRLFLTEQSNRLHCRVCGDVRSGARKGLPCPKCHGDLIVWTDDEVRESRTVRRIRKPEAIPLVAREHTAQITTADRLDYENKFKAPASESPVNVLACSPTLEMGIDVGGLDAVVMRNVPPRPDNYAQRGGRAGRRSRVGLVVGYARSTPHDQYFYDKPEDMIAGEVPAPNLSLGNRDVLIRHLNAVAFGVAEPGLAGRMFEYIDAQGNVKHEAVAILIEAVKAQYGYAVEIAQAAWGQDVLSNAGLGEAELREHLERIPEAIHRVINSTAKQVQELRKALDYFAQNLEGKSRGVHASDLVARLLGIPTNDKGKAGEADDRSAGYPLRRFAEYGLLPGYEFPSEPATLRLLWDPHEEDPLSVVRRFGIGQFQPDAHVYARGGRWKVRGLDMASPWNPQTDGPTWRYRLCDTCGLHYKSDMPKCPRCGTITLGHAIPAFEFAGFIAAKDEQPIMDEEDRFAVRNLVRIHPQWDGNVVSRWTVGNGWGVQLSRNENVCWLNEGPPPTGKDLDDGTLLLHPKAKGWFVCPECGNLLTPVVPVLPKKGKKNAVTSPAAKPAAEGHTKNCPRQAFSPTPHAIVTGNSVEVLRVIVPIPYIENDDRWTSWGLTLGYSLLIGMQRQFVLSSGELEFELEGPWKVEENGRTFGKLSLSFIDPSLGGSGYLSRVAESFDQVATRALEHLDHKGCDSACYRCLKDYRNQRYHDQLSWPQVIAALEEMGAAQPRPRPRQTGDIDDPKPWLDAYDAGVGSPLELRFMRLFEQFGFHPEKQVPVSPKDGDQPISVADFAVPERRLAIYIDGAVFHIGKNLRRDKSIRDRLRTGSPPWRVEELRASDLAHGEALVRKLKP